MSGFLKRFAMFGVPGLALFAFLYLLDRFNWEFERIPAVLGGGHSHYSSIIVVGGVTLCALYWFGSPPRLRH